jgi:hypothetical protein
MENLQWQRQVAVIHTGYEMGFVDGDLLTPEAKSMKDHHKEMDGRRSKGWFAEVLPCLEINMVTVMENALYHAVMVDNISNQIWKETPRIC